MTLTVDRNMALGLLPCLFGGRGRKRFVRRQGSTLDATLSHRALCASLCIVAHRYMIIPGYRLILVAGLSIVFRISMIMFRRLTILFQCATIVLHSLSMVFLPDIGRGVQFFSAFLCVSFSFFPSK